jgi:hypothetical protein
MMQCPKADGVKKAQFQFTEEHRGLGHHKGFNTVRFAMTSGSVLKDTNFARRGGVHSSNLSTQETEGRVC